MKLLNRAEEIVLLSIWKLQEKAYGITIREDVIKTTGYKWSIGAVYAPLNRLEKKGMVKTKVGDPLPERGGKSRIYYTVTIEGKNALNEIKRVHEELWDDIPSMGMEEA